MIVVTGSTGHIGSELVRLLSERREAFRTVGHTDLAQPDRLATAFAGADKLFLLTANSEDMVRLQIDTRDIAAAAVVTLTDAGHEGKVYTLTGPQAISYREATEILSRVLGRPLKYVAESEDEAWHRLRDEKVTNTETAPSPGPAGHPLPRERVPRSGG